MRQRTPSEIKAYGDGYAEAYKQFQYLIEKHDISTAVRKMKIFADAVALTVETATDTADTPQTDWYCYITEDRDTQVLDAWQVKQMQEGKE